MGRRGIGVIPVFLFLVAGYTGIWMVDVAGFSGITGSAPQARTTTSCRRIVSLAPSITEVLFSLGLGDRVVGVTRYCTYPPEAMTRKKVGGYYDPSYEAILSLEPDLVVLLPEHREAQQYLHRLGLNVLMVDHRGIEGILNSITEIGRVCGAEKEAGRMVGHIQGRMEYIRSKTEGLLRPRVMVFIGREMEEGILRDAYISGRDGFYNEMIALAGGRNAYEGDIFFPLVSPEGIVRMNPEVIIELIPETGMDRARVLEEWKKNIPGVDAVRDGRVYVLDGDYVLIPGPRFIRILERMARVIHPEVDWEDG